MNKTITICLYVIILTIHNNPDYNDKEFLKATFRALALRQSEGLMLETPS